MHFTHHLLALTLLPILPSLASPSTAKARIWTEFFPSCPTTRLPKANPNLPNEEFISALTIFPGVCSPIYVPLYGPMALSHMSFDAEVKFTGPEGARSAGKCSIAIHEVPGCVDPPLLHEEAEVEYNYGYGYGYGFASSGCVARGFSYNQVWVRLDCEEAKEGEGEVEPGHMHRPFLHGNKSMEVGKNLNLNMNQTVANLTAPYLNSTSSGIVARSGLLRRALRIRL